MSKTSRQRDLIHSFGTGIQKSVTVNSVSGTTVNGPVSAAWPDLKGKQVTVSEGHPFRTLSQSNKGDIGGEFFTQKTYVLNKPQHITAQGVKTSSFTGPPSGTTTTTGTYTGPVSPVRPSDMAFPAAFNSTTGQLEAIGTTAVARCSPTNSLANASTFLGELIKDGLPHLIGSAGWKDRNKVLRDSGSEFLNIEFGWLPFVSDIRSFASAVNRASAVLKQFERDSGRQVRRTYQFPPVRTSETLIVAGNQGAYWTPGSSTVASDHASDYGDRVLTRETVKRQWFSGAFTYHLPSGYDSRNQMDRYALYAQKILGASLTPETIWNLSPWSWAADWFSNAGDVVSNISDWQSYGLVLRYGYMMEHTISINTYSLNGGSGFLAPLRVRPVSLVTETKKRVKANPFGFGVSWSGLSPLQLSIAAALGLSRS